MSISNNRIRQARRSAKLTQTELAERVGVHRSAVAQWEAREGARPTADKLARLAIAMGVQFEWLATGRGRMKYTSDFVPGEETPALLLEYGAQSETEVRALIGLRRLDTRSAIAIVEMIEALCKPMRLKSSRQAAYSR